MTRFRISPDGKTVTRLDTPNPLEQQERKRKITYNEIMRDSKTALEQEQALDKAVARYLESKAGQKAIDNYFSSPAGQAQIQKAVGNSTGAGTSTPAEKPDLEGFFSSFAGQAKIKTVVEQAVGAKMAGLKTTVETAVESHLQGYPVQNKLKGWVEGIARSFLK
jgi:hypothetical protein